MTGDDMTEELNAVIERLRNEVEINKEEGSPAASHLPNLMHDIETLLDAIDHTNAVPETREGHGGENVRADVADEDAASRGWIAEVQSSREDLTSRVEKLEHWVQTEEKARHPMHLVETDAERRERLTGIPEQLWALRYATKGEPLPVSPEQAEANAGISRDIRRYRAWAAAKVTDIERANETIRMHLYQAAPAKLYEGSDDPWQAHDCKVCDALREWLRIVDPTDVHDKELREKIDAVHHLARFAALDPADREKVDATFKTIHSLAATAQLQIALHKKTATERDKAESDLKATRAALEESQLRGIEDRRQVHQLMRDKAWLRDSLEIAEQELAVAEQKIAAREELADLESQSSLYEYRTLVLTDGGGVSSVSGTFDTLDQARMWRNEAPARIMQRREKKLRGFDSPWGDGRRQPHQERRRSRTGEPVMLERMVSVSQRELESLKDDKRRLAKSLVETLAKRSRDQLEIQALMKELEVTREQLELAHKAGLGFEKLWLEASTRLVNIRELLT
jgi:hypothetical protein